MYQRLGLAQALLHEPDLLILDEPTDGLDPVGRSEVRRLLLELKSRGKTIFLNSHILQEVELVCDRVAVMAAGQVRGVGTIEELTQRLGDRQVKWDLAGVDDQQALGRLLSDAAGITVHDGEAFMRSAATGGEKTGGRAVLLDRLPSGVVRATVPWVDQAVIDRTIDQLRASGTSIVSLTTPRRSLEDVFLSLVGSTEAEVDSDIAASAGWKPSNEVEEVIESAVVGARGDGNSVNGVTR
jgi:ABC-2 type transport system ATP-binding protein